MPLKLPAFFKRNHHVGEQTVLKYRRIYILPCKNGLSFGIILSIMLLGSMNYNLSLGYMLCFLLGGMSFASILHTFRNMLSIKISVGRTRPCYAGSKAGYTLILESTQQRAHESIFITTEDGESEVVNIPQNGKVEVPITRLSTRRGMMPLGTISLFSVYPLGLFKAWSILEFSTACPIYPRPADEVSYTPQSQDGEGLGNSFETNQGHDDFSGLRQYHPGDSLKHVAWKAVARGQGMLTKQFTGLGKATVWLDWQQLEGLDTEQRLSGLCRWILDAEKEDREYGLKLPGLEIPPNKGPAHKENCLTALALFQI